MLVVHSTVSAGAQDVRSFVVRCAERREKWGSTVFGPFPAVFARL